MTAPALASMTEREYRGLPGLSNSAMKDLAISPLRFWHKHINPEQPADEPTPEMQFGSALHCAVLEPDAFLDRYACEVSAEDYPGCLVTMEDLRAWVRDHGHTPKGTRKQDVIAQVQALAADLPNDAPPVHIFDVIERQQFAANQGKVTFKKADWLRIYRAAASLQSEPRVREIMREGAAEVPMFATDELTGVRLKARMDWVAPDCILDLKTFSQKRGKSIDKSIADAIFYEGYYRQAYLYSLIRGWPKTFGGEFVIAFVESEEPHEVRIRSLRPKVGGEVCLYWERARIEVRELIRLFDECVRHFGIDKPWRYAQEIDPLTDEDMKAMVWS